MALDPDYTQYFLNSETTIVKLETIEISHSALVEPIYLVRNAGSGLTATLEDSSEVTFTFVPMEIRPVTNDQTLDTGYQISISDVGTVLGEALKLIAAADTFDEYPVVKYRAFRSDDLTKPMFGPVTVQMANITSDATGASLDAVPPNANVKATGENQTLERFPMLEQFV